MTRRQGDGFHAALDDIYRQRNRDRRGRSQADREAARHADDERDDRQARRDRMAAVHAAAPEDRQRVEDLHDGIEADVLRERAAATRRRPPPPDHDAGRGTGSGAPAGPHIPTYRNP